MISYSVSKYISKFLSEQKDSFTLDQLASYLRFKGKKVSKQDLLEILRSTNFVFPLINDEFITRAGVFTGRLFSFMPSKEEIEKKHILIGHRCMPFINPEIPPDSIEVVANGKIIQKEPTVFSMNLALDTFALFGEGYEIPLIFNDEANDSCSLANIKYNLPKEIKLTSWPLDKISKNKEFNYGDRILCQVVDWESCLVEMSVLKNESSKYIISSAAIEREEWYSNFEEGLLNSFNRNGPCSSIEEQLAFLFLENQEQLCIRNCGSSEEFLKHTKKIGFSQFGVESRIWFNGESVPYVGDWNREFSKDVILNDITVSYSPILIDSYVKNYIYEEKRGKNKQGLEKLITIIFPSSLKMTASENKFILLNLQSRYDILKNQYDDFLENKVSPVRERILELYTQINELICSIGCSGLNAEDFPQQELIILTQLFTHCVKMIEELETFADRTLIPLDDIQLSLDGMEDTFYDIYDTLKSSLEYNIYKGFEVVGGRKNGK